MRMSRVVILLCSIALAVGMGPPKAEPRFVDVAEFWSSLALLNHDLDKSGTLTLDELQNLHLEIIEGTSIPKNDDLEMSLKMFDVNMDGGLSQKEYARLAVFFTSLMDEVQLGQIMAKADTDLAEMVMMIKNDTEHRTDLMWRMVDYLDKDYDGQIDVDEMKAFAAAGAAAALKQFDQDGSGTLDFNEFTALFEATFNSQTEDQNKMFVAKYPHIVLPPMTCNDESSLAFIDKPGS